MIETVVESVRVQMNTQNRVVFLKERHGDRHLPIWIGDFEAQAIVIELQGVESPRPLPYDVMRALLAELGGNVERILIVDLSHDVYFARIVISAGDRQVEIDARPSDAIALAVRSGAPILVDENVMERAGVSLESEDEAGEDGPRDAQGDRPERAEGVSVDDERLSIFRDFINTLDIEDPDRGRGN